MEEKQQSLSDTLRQQYDIDPFPIVPLEHSPQDSRLSLFNHYLTIPYYVRDRTVVETRGKVILDAGCGSGYKSLVLATANPGAKVVGVDFSAKSIPVARQRLQYHHFDTAEFHVLAVEDLASLNLQFDYINCDEVLYFLDDPIAGLQAMKSVLKPDGIIRFNLHSSIQRSHYYRAQQVFKMMGLMDRAPQELEIGLVREVIQALKDNVALKQSTWMPSFEVSKEELLMNYLIVGDKGFTIPEMFSILKAANLEFISMLIWQQWRLETLFKDPDDLPAFLAFSLPELSQEEQLELFELLQPKHRLLDVWCGHPGRSQPGLPTDEWSLAEWQQTQVHLHPYLQTPEFEAAMAESAAKCKPLSMKQYWPLADETMTLDSAVVALLLPLMAGPQSFLSLVARSRQLRPLDPVTLTPTHPEEIFRLTTLMLQGLEYSGCILLELRSS